MSYQDDIRRTLERVGISASSLDRIRLARGVVGKASYVAAAAVLGLIIVAWALRDPGYLLVVGGLIVFIFIAYFLGVLWFANKHPGVALLEGAELIQWRQMDMAAKSVPDAERVAASAPQLIGGDQSGR